MEKQNDTENTAITSNGVLSEVVSPSRQELIDCVRNLMGVFDTPIARRRMEGKWVDEVRLNGRDVMERLGRNNFT